MSTSKFLRNPACHLQSNLQHVQSAPDQTVWKLLFCSSICNALCVQFGQAWSDLPAPVHLYIGSIVGGEKIAEG